MKRLLRILPAVIAVGALAGSGTAMAFPTSSTVYPSSGSCYGKTVATAYYGGLGEEVEVATSETTSCTYVTAQACIMTSSLACTGVDSDPGFAFQSASTADYYYAYGYGSAEGNSTLSTLSVHP